MVNNTKDVITALHFAANAHNGQFRKGPKHEPYINHLIEVVHILTNADILDSNTLMIAALHDVVEDTNKTEDELRIEFGDHIADGVKLLSDDKLLSLEVRRAHQIEHAEKLPDHLKLVKIADHCSNIISIPEKWGKNELMVYLGWSREVINNCKGINEELDNEYSLRSNRITTMISDMITL